MEQTRQEYSGVIYEMVRQLESGGLTSRKWEVPLQTPANVTIGTSHFRLFSFPSATCHFCSCRVYDWRLLASG